MKIINLKLNEDYLNLKKIDKRGLVAAIGNFDGLHIGHKRLLNEAKKEAKNKNLPFAIITFNPHPREFFLKDKVGFKITDNLEKQRLIRKFKTEILIQVLFNEQLRNLNPNDFIEKILKKTLNVKLLFAGVNFRFGKNRSGSLIDAKTQFKKHEIEPKCCELLQNNSNEIISSETIRQNIRLCNFEQIKFSLGRCWAITGKVEYGDQVGAKIGFPTANLHLKDHVNPKFGVYLTNTYIMSNDGQKFISEKIPSITNFGIRPTIEGKKVLFETHILNIDKYLNEKNLYNKRIYVELKAFLRPEQKFDNLEKLKDQINIDIKKAKELHNYK